MAELTEFLVLDKKKTAGHSQFVPSHTPLSWLPQHKEWKQERLEFKLNAGVLPSECLACLILNTQILPAQVYCNFDL